jgi:hypothetical protein
MITWKITRLSSEGNALKDCHYVVWVNDGTNRVETQGNWTFSDRTVTKPFSEITEEDVVDLIKKETTQNDVCIIESRLMDQLQSVENSNDKHLPWLPAVFTPNI